MLKQISKVMSVAVMGFCLFGSVVVSTSNLNNSVCAPAGCPGIGDPLEVKTNTGLTAPPCPEGGCPSYGCTRQEDGTCTVDFGENDNDAKSNFVLGVTRYLTFIIVAISVAMFPISIICSIVFFIIKSKYLKTSLILIGVSVVAFAFAILGYTLIGYLVSKTQL
jgi:hypothetical protein